MDWNLVGGAVNMNSARLILLGIGGWGRNSRSSEHISIISAAIPTHEVFRLTSC